MKKSEINDFRKHLRKFELLLDKQLSKSVCLHKVTLPQCHTLLEIENLKVCTLNELAIAVNLEKSTVSRTIDTLVKKGLVQRDINPQNRRETNISLTENGISTVNDINKENNTFFINVFKNLADKNSMEFIKSFHLFVEAFELTIN